MAFMIVRRSDRMLAANRKCSTRNEAWTDDLQEASLYAMRRFAEEECDPITEVVMDVTEFLLGKEP